MGIPGPGTIGQLRDTGLGEAGEVRISDRAPVGGLSRPALGHSHQTPAGCACNPDKIQPFEKVGNLRYRYPSNNYQFLKSASF